jgi:hypothetical protein
MLQLPLNEIINAEEKSNPRFKGPCYNWLLSCAMSMSEKMLIVGAFLYYCGGGRLLILLYMLGNHIFHDLKTTTTILHNYYLQNSYLLLEFNMNY